MNASHREYINRINRVIDYIDKHITDDLSVAELASVANFSPFHFHRIFSAFVGEPQYAFIKRLKIEKAASMLLNSPEKSVNEIAWDCGYKSDSVFCRTFKEHFGMNTADFRKSKANEIRKIRQSLSKNGKPGQQRDDYVCSVETIKNISQMKNIRIQQQPAMELVYIRHTGAFDQIGLAYARLMQWAGPRGLLTPQVKTATIYHDDPTVTEMDKVRQSACITVDREIKTEGEFGNISLPAGKYVVGSFEIGPEGFTDAWNQVCLWLAESGYQPSDGQPYELYYNNHEEHPEKKFIVDICIPVKPM